MFVFCAIPALRNTKYAVSNPRIFRLRQAAIFDHKIFRFWGVKIDIFGKWRIESGGALPWDQIEGGGGHTGLSISSTQIWVQHEFNTRSWRVHHEFGDHELQLRVWYELGSGSLLRARQIEFAAASSAPWVRHREFGTSSARVRARESSSGPSRAGCERPQASPVSGWKDLQDPDRCVWGGIRGIRITRTPLITRTPPSYWPIW